MISISRGCDPTVVNGIKSEIINKNECYQVNVPQYTNDVFVSADDCLAAYNKGGLLIHFQDNDEIVKNKAKDFASNLLTDSNLDTNGNKINLQDLLIDFAKLKPVSEIKEIRRDIRGETRKILRYELEDGSVIDKTLYNLCHSLVDGDTHYNGYLLMSSLNGVYPSKINTDDYKISIGIQGTKIGIYALDKNNNKISKTFRKEGDVASVTGIDGSKSKYYSMDGTESDVAPSEPRIFFT